MNEESEEQRFIMCVKLVVIAFLFCIYTKKGQGERESAVALGQVLSRRSNGM